ncbi:MAG: transferrin-binding protein-like solute binding protein [Neisseriaceae bacterium]|nr:transferrin-binding protein-like solute binding protein [Neisseriaceae bacterium]
MKHTLTLITTLSALVLTACGGGGGGSDSPVAVNQPIDGGGNTGNPSRPSITNDFVKGGKAIQFVNGKQTTEMDSFTGMSPEKWGMIKIDGKELLLMPDSRGTVGHHGWAPSKNAEMSYHHLGTVGFARFGVMHDTKNKSDYVFYIGEEHITPINEIPSTKDPVKYGGYAVAYRPSDKKTFSTYANDNPYPVNFTVNFAEKTVNGKIDQMFDYTNGKSNRSTPNIKDIELSATIKGNKFSGTKNGVSTEGIFVGSQATEMTGLFKDNNHKIQGAFGARKQGK